MDVRRSIQQSELAEGLSDGQIQDLVGIARVFGFKKGEYLFQLGDQAETLYLIGRGIVQLTLPLVVLGSNKDVVVEELSAVSTIAWSALVEPLVFTMSARATTDVELVGLSRTGLLGLFESSPETGYLVFRNLAAVVGRRLHVTQALWARELQRSVSEKYK